MPRPNRNEIEHNLRERIRILPMKHDLTKKKISCEEWVEYGLRSELYRSYNQNDETQLNKPLPQTAEKIWKLLSLNKLEYFKHWLEDSYAWLNDEEKADLWIKRKQALVIVLDICITYAQIQRAISCNRIFESLCSGFSEHYILSSTKLVRDMKYDTVFACRRDLLLNGIDVNKFWHLLRKWSKKQHNSQRNPLFTLKTRPFDGKSQPIILELNNLSHLEEFLKILKEDRQYIRTDFPCIRVLFEKPKKEQEEERYQNRKICADIPYNEVMLGQRSKDLLSRMEEVSLLFDVKAFKEDYETLQKQKEDLLQLITRSYDVDPRLSNTKRWQWTNKWNKKQIYSKRDAFLYYRSIEEGLRSKKSEKPTYRVRGKSGQDRNKAQEERNCHQRQTNKWQRTLSNFLYWRKKNKRGGSRRISLQELKAAATATIDWREKVRERLNRYDRMQQFILGYRHVYDQVKNKTNNLPIYTRWYRIINRRYQAMHFWPTFVTPKHNLRLMEDEIQFDVPTDEEPGEGEPGFMIPAEEELKSFRKRWFKDPDLLCDLVGLDISSSQTQIIAKFLCIEELEELTANESFKVKMAQLLWKKNEEFPLLRSDRRSAQNYQGPADLRLQNLCKDLWMRVSYGGSIWTAVEDQQADPTTFGPGWISKPKAAERFLNECLYKKYPGIKTFLEMCRFVAKIAYEENPYSGVKFTDPFDCETVRWNPVVRDYVPKSSGGFKLILKLPGKKIKDHFKENKPAARNKHKGEYPVDKERLKRVVAPCLIHMLDAYYSALVMEKLMERNINTFVAIHDCWLLPEKVIHNNETRNGIQELYAVLDEAAIDWYKGLECVYEGLRGYLLKGENQLFGSTKLKQPSEKNHVELENLHECIEQIDTAFEKWKVRVKNNYVPRFGAVLE